MINHLKHAIVLAACLGAAGAQAASLDGDQVGGQALYNPAYGPFNAFAANVSDPAPVLATVGAGVEFAEGASQFIDLTADIAGDTVAIDLINLIDEENSTVSFEFIFSDLDFDIGALTGFSIISNAWTGTPLITTGADWVSLLFSGQGLAANETKSFLGRFEASVAAVPLPAGALLLPFALGALVLAGRRRA